MARNFAQIAFLLYALAILLISRKHLVHLLVRRIGKRAFASRVRGGANAFLFLTVKEAMGKGLFILNLASWCALGLSLVLHLLLGWFSVFALFFRILNALVLVTGSVEAYLLTLSGNLAQFGEAFFLYRVDTDPNHDRAFASSIVDGICYLVIPLILAICNFTL